MPRASLALGVTSGRGGAGLLLFKMPVSHQKPKAQTSANRTYSRCVWTPEWVLCCASAWVAKSVKPMQSVADAVSLFISLTRKAIRPLKASIDDDGNGVAPPVQKQRGIKGLISHECASPSNLRLTIFLRLRPLRVYFPKMSRIAARVGRFDEVAQRDPIEVPRLSRPRIRYFGRGVG